MRTHTRSLCLKIPPQKFAHSLPERVCYSTLHRFPLPSYHISAMIGLSERERGRGGEQTFRFLETSIKSGKVKVEGEMCRQEEEVWEMENRETTEGWSCFYYCSSEWWCWGLVLHLCGEKSHSKGNNSKAKYLCNCTTFIINILHISKVFRCWTHLWQQNIEKRPCCLRKDLKLNFFS